MKRLNLLICAIMIASFLVACEGETKEVIVTQVVKETVVEKETIVETVVETVVVEGTPEVVEKIVQVTVEPEPVDTSKFGGSLVIQTAGMVQFDYALCADDSSFYVISNVFDTIYKIDKDHNVFPGLATSWEYMDDTTLILYLRKGVMWHDGNDVFPEGESREVVADDVIYSIVRGIEMEGSTLPPDLLTSFESAEAIDDYTVQINLSQPDALLLSGARGLGHIAVVPKEAVEYYGEDFGMNPIGSGPFKFVEYKPDEYVKLERNDNYYIQPYVDQVIFQVVPDEDAALIAFETGEVDYLGSVPEADIERLKDDTRFVLESGGYQCAPWIMFDMAVPLFQSQEFRQALAYAIDAEGISRSIERSTYVGGCGIAGEGVPGYDPTLCKYFPFDPDGALEILADLGWEDSDGDGVLDKDGEPMDFQLEVWNMDTAPNYGEAIVIQLQEIGIPAELLTVEFGTWIDDLFAGPQKAMFASGFCTDGGLNGVFGKDAATSAALGYDLPEVHALLDEANTTIDAGKRDNILREAQDKLFSTYNAIPLRHRAGYFATRSWVHDFGGLNWTANIVTDRNNTWVTK